MEEYKKEREIIKSFQDVKKRVDEIIKESRMPVSIFAELLGLKRTRFYYKRKQSEFTAEEINKILGFIEQTNSAVSQ